MKELRSRALRAFNQDYAEKKICGENNLCVGYYLRDEETIIRHRMAARAHCVARRSSTPSRLSRRFRTASGSDRIIKATWKTPSTFASISAEARSGSGRY